MNNFKDIIKKNREKAKTNAGISNEPNIFNVSDIVNSAKQNDIIIDKVKPMVDTYANLKMDAGMAQNFEAAIWKNIESSVKLCMV